MPPLDALSFSSVFDAILHLEESEKMILAATRPALLECPGVWQEAASSVEKETNKSWPQVKPCEPRGNATRIRQSFFPKVGRAIVSPKWHIIGMR